MVVLTGLLSSLAVLSPGVAPVPEVAKADGLIVVNCGDHLRFLNEAGREVSRYTPPKAEGWPAWRIGSVSPDGSRVILTATVGEMSYRRMVIGRVDGKEPLQLIEPPGGAPAEVMWAPDGKHLIYTRSADDGAFGIGYHYVNLKYSLEDKWVEVMNLPAIEGRSPNGFQQRDWGITAEAYRRSLHHVVGASRDGKSFLTIMQEHAQIGSPRHLTWVTNGGKSVQQLLDKTMYTWWYPDLNGSFSPRQREVLIPVWSQNPNPGAPSDFHGAFLFKEGEAGNERIIAPPPDMIGGSQVRVAWSPDGKRIAFAYHARTKDDKFEYRVQSHNPDGSDPRVVFSVTGAEEKVRTYRLEGWR